MTHEDTTTRDRMWVRVLVHLAEQEGLYLSDIVYEDSKKATARRTLRSMESMGILERPSGQQGQEWKRGPLLQLLLKSVVHPDSDTEEILETVRKLTDQTDSK